MLFKNSAKLREFASANALDFHAVKSIIEQVEAKHIETLLGDEYTALNTAFTDAVDESELTSAQANLLYKCRQVIAPYVCYYYAPVADAQLTDAGVRRLETETSKTAYQYQLKNYRDANLAMAENASENLLYFLETNVGTYTLWAASDQYAEFRSLFIRTGQEMQMLFPTASPYSIYWACRSKMYDIEETEIRTLLGSTLFDGLKTRSLAGTLTAKEIVLVTKLKRAIANMAIGFNIPLLNITVGRHGLSMITQAPRATNDDVSKNSNADGSSISHAQRSILASAKQWIQNATTYMTDNAADFADYPGNSDTSATNIDQSTLTTFGLI